MNLTKLFNINYFKENVKKSKGIILISSLIVPILTAIIVIFNLNSNEIITVVDKTDFIWINTIGMYVIPVILSFCLFGFVYKRNSVDFIGSMPLNRKTIFLTNTIGGILLITLIELITAIILFLCNKFCINIEIFPEMIFDVFSFMWVSYVFVFITTNLAMTVCGTHLAQIALTMLILFLIPFCNDALNGFETYREYTFYSVNNEFTSDVTKYSSNYTLPYQIINSFFLGVPNNWNFYSTKSIVKMLVLNLIYFTIGLILFKKRKMENTEESFGSTFLHLIIKALTILPMLLFLNAIKGPLRFNAFAVTLIVIYYFVFDYIVKRKIKLFVSIVFLVVSMIIMQVICFETGKMVDNKKSNIINRNDISKVEIQSWYVRKSIDEHYNVNANELFDGTINDKEIIDAIFDLGISSNYYTMSNYERYENVDVQMNLYNKKGDIIQADIYFKYSDFEKIIDLLYNDTNYIQSIKNAYYNDGLLYVENLKINDENKAIILSEIETKINSRDNIEDLLNNPDFSNCKLYNYYYSNHTLQMRAIPINLNAKILEICVNILNNNAKNVINNISYDENNSKYFYIMEQTELDKTYYNSEMLDEENVEITDIDM